VLQLWSGLGYYARARNLWRAARVIVERYDGRLPESFDELQDLPGVGRSTAGAILAQAHGARLPILDGNVKRVLARYHAVDGWPGEQSVQRLLWAYAEQHTPHSGVADYTQAIMDLGATVCTRTRPACTVCPLAPACRACAAGTQARYPAPRPKRARPQRRAAVVIVRAPDGRVLLERRPAAGIWGGLHSLPECAADDAAAWCRHRLGSNIVATRRLATIAHGFTHFDLELEPWLVEVNGVPDVVHDAGGWSWHAPGQALNVGVPAPIAALLRSLPDIHDETRGE